VTTFQIIIRKVGVYYSKPIWSFIRNLVFWIGHLNKITWVRNEMKTLREWKLEPLMAIFTWVEDKGGDWTQWVVTLVSSNFSGDCEDAANLALWWFKNHGVEAEILNLYSSKYGHTICVTKDRTKMVSNGNVITLNPDTWEQDVMKYFGNEYEVIL